MFIQAYKKPENTTTTTTTSMQHDKPFSTSGKPASPTTAARNNNRFLSKAAFSNLNRGMSVQSLPAEREIEFFFAAHASVATDETERARNNNAAASSGGDPAVKLIRRRNLAEALEAFRMAATNLSTSPEKLSETKAKLCAALDECGTLEQVLRSFERRMESLEASVLKSTPSYRHKSCYTQQLMHEVVSKLFVGSYHPANDPELLKQSGVTRVLCCINVAPRHPDKFEYLVLPADDSPNYNMAQHFDKCFTFIDAALSRGEGCLVHCGAGISRAPSVCAAYLIKKLKISADEAVAMIQKVRSCASPNAGFQRQLMEYAMQFGK